jgi:hypothetical protein
MTYQTSKCHAVFRGRLENLRASLVNNVPPAMTAGTHIKAEWCALFGTVSNPLVFWLTFWEMAEDVASER